MKGNLLNAWYFSLLVNSFREGNASILGPMKPLVQVFYYFPFLCVIHIRIINTNYCLNIISPGSMGGRAVKKKVPNAPPMNLKFVSFTASRAYFT